MYSQIAGNKRKTVALIVLFIAVITGLSWLFAQYTGRPSITLAVLIGASVYALITYFAAAKMAIVMNGAHQIEKRDNPRYYRIVENLAITNGMPMPKVYVINDAALNAFATGRDPNHSVVAATSGLLETLDDQELEGVMAHEMGHVKNYDIRVSMVAFALVAVVGIISDIILRMAWFGGGDDDAQVLPDLLLADILIPGRRAQRLVQGAILGRGCKGRGGCFVIHRGREVF